MPKVMNSDSACVSAPLVRISALLSSPQTRPTEIPIRIAGPCPTLSIIVTVTTATREMMPPIDRSRNPAMMTNVIPRAAKISVPNCRRMLSKFSAVRNFGSTRDVTITRRAIATKMGLFLRTSMAVCELTRPSNGSRCCAHANSKALAMISSAEADARVELSVDPPFADRVDTVAHVEDLRKLG